MTRHDKRATTGLRDARLAVFLNLPMHEVDGDYMARYPHLFDFFIALGGVTAETALVLPLKRSAQRDPDYGTVTLPNGVRVVGLPYWSSAPMLVRRFWLVVPATVRTAFRELGRVDVVGAVAPSVVGTILIALARARRRPVFLMVRGEKQRTVKFIMGNRRARPYVAALRVMEAPVRRWIAAGVPAFVAGHELVERYRQPNSRLYDLYPALSRNFPLADAPRSETSRSDVPRLVTVARLSPEKGIDDLLRAVAILRDLETDVIVDIAGDGPQRTELVALTRSLGLADAVRFRGFVQHGPKLISLLDCADVFVLASRSEGLPHSLVEAMARGLPVVTSAVGGMPAFLRDGAGIVVPVADPAGLASALQALLSDAPRRAELSARALERARSVHPDTQLREFSARLAAAYPQLTRGARPDIGR